MTSFYFSANVQFILYRQNIPYRLIALSLYGFANLLHVLQFKNHYFFRLQVVNGYFVHFFAPKVQDRLPRDVIFIIDASGSMYGRKMVQVKEALRKILADLLEGDSFVAFSLASIKTRNYLHATVISNAP